MRTQGTLTDKGKADIARMEFKITDGAGGISRIRNGYAEALKLLMALVAMLLVICCANVSNILLARATGRQQEIATRVALGASRSRIIRQVLTETAMIGIIGGATGLALAYWGAVFLSAMAFPRSSRPPTNSVMNACRAGMSMALTTPSTRLSAARLDTPAAP